MNYAEDRLDRRARYPDGIQMLWRDYRHAMNHSDHSLLGKTLRDAGWNRQALFHFGQAWIHDPDNWKTAADYIQMTDLAGYPAMGIIAVLVYRHRLPLLWSEQVDCGKDIAISAGGCTTTFEQLYSSTSSTSTVTREEDMMGPTSESPPIHQDCGCGHYPHCGGPVCYLPFSQDTVNRAREQLQSCLENLHEIMYIVSEQRISAHTILRHHHHQSSATTDGKTKQRVAENRMNITTPTGGPTVTNLFKCTSTNLASTPSLSPKCALPSTSSTQRQQGEDKLLWRLLIPGILLRRPFPTDIQPSTLSHLISVLHMLGVPIDCIRQHEQHVWLSLASSSLATSLPRGLPPPFHLLFMKLLYVVVPLWSVLLVTMTHFHDNDDADGNRDSVVQELTTQYKSHYAYFIFLRSLILGCTDQRVKPARRFTVPYYHVPIWDLVVGLDHRRDYYSDSYGNYNSGDDTTEDGMGHDRQRTQYHGLQDDGFPTTATITITAHVTNNNSNSNNSKHDETDKCISSESNSTGYFLDRISRLALHCSRFHEPTLPSPNVFFYSTKVFGRDSSYPPLILIGDSHVLSLAWHVVRFPENRYRRVIPVLIPGLKAWHTRPQTRFFTKTHWYTALMRWTTSNANMGAKRIRTVVVSAGEIDCREGLGGPLLQGYTCSPAMEEELVQQTVSEYTAALRDVAERFRLQVLVMPVPPHLQKRTGRVQSRQVRGSTTKRWNDALRSQLRVTQGQQWRLPYHHKQQLQVTQHGEVFFLDYESSLICSETSVRKSAGVKRIKDPQRCMGAQYILKPVLNADSTHMNSAFARHFEQAVVECGCNLELL